MDPEQIGITVGLVVAASLALQTALGPAMANICEAIKATGRIPAGSAGLVSLGLGTGLGAAAGLLAGAQVGQLNPLWIGVGAFAGLIGLGAGGVRSHLVEQGSQQQAVWTASKAGLPAAPEHLGAPQAPGQPAGLALVGSTEHATG